MEMYYSVKPQNALTSELEQEIFRTVKTYSNNYHYLQSYNLTDTIEKEPMPG